MERRIGSLSAEIIAGESAKFTAPLLLLHGLWNTAQVWRPFMGYLAHRGWLCIALHLPGRAGHEAVAGVDDHVARVRAAAAALDAPPVLLGHDFGALLAVQAAASARAVVALAPLVPVPIAARPPPSLHRAGTWLARRLGRPLRRPGGRWAAAYGPPARSVREPARLVGQLLGGAVRVSPVAAHVPSLVLAGEHDPVTPVEAARALAQRVGAEFQVCAGGHALPSEAGWEQRVSDVHRWLVQRLGASLLALYEEAGAE